MGVLVLYGLIAIILVNVLYFGTAIVFLRFGIKKLATNRKVAVCFLVASTFPLVVYLGYAAKLAIEKHNRPAELAALPRKPVPEGHEIKSLRVWDSMSSVRITSLISSGALERIELFDARDNAVTRVLQARKGPACVKIAARSSIDLDLRSAARAKNAFHLCHEESGDQGGPGAEVWLYLDRNAPNRNKKCLPSGGTAIELRWAPRLGRQLIAYEEIQYFRQIHSPFILPSIEEMFWVTCRSTVASQIRSRDEIEKERRRLDPFYLVSDSLGLSGIEDFPREVAEAEALEALKILNEEPGRDAPKGITLLLGQWPPNPDTSSYIRSNVRAGRVVYRFFTTLEDDNVDRDLIPHLESHKADFLAICERATSYTNYCKRWRSAAAQRQLPADFAGRS